MPSEQISTEILRGLVTACHATARSLGIDPLSPDNGLSVSLAEPQRHLESLFKTLEETLRIAKLRAEYIRNFCRDDKEMRKEAAEIVRAIEVVLK